MGLLSGFRNPPHNLPVKTCALRTAILLAAQMGAQLERGEVLQQSLQPAGRA